MAYRKLRTSRNGFGSWSRLYIGDDHILSIESNTFTEKYYRFYFSDIQAIIVRRTDRGTIWSVILLAVALLMTTCSITSNPSGEWSPTPGYLILALMALAIMIVNMVRGPSCDTRIQTSITVQKIGALHRLKKSGEILPELRSHIRAVQGSLTSEQIIRNTVMPDQEIVTEDETVPEHPVQEYEPAVRDPTGFHRFAFAAVLVNAGLNALWLFFHGVTVYVIWALGSLVAFCGVIAALIAQTRKNTRDTVRKFTWAVFISYLGLFFMSYFLNIYYMVRSGIERLGEKRGFNPFSFYSELVDKGPMDKPGLVALAIISIALYLFLGVSGLASVGARKSGTGDQAGENNSGSGP